jgi:ATP-dependent 26S proteasome regulatory subunit
MINAEENEQYIVLLEDIDTLSLKREDIIKEGGNYEDILNGLMQFLDSNISPDNVIFIATTNHIERLDDAMLRAGRFDLKVKIDPITEKDIEKFTKILEYKGPISDIVKEYGEPMHLDGRDLYNQSKLQNIIITKKGYKLENEIEE